MSSTSTPDDSPIATSIQPLHNPSRAAHVVVPQAPLGNVVNQAPGMGTKALLAKRKANNSNPAFISPSDNMTPCTQKLSAAKRKYFTKAEKPVQLFSKLQEHSSDIETDDATMKENPLLNDEDGENPF